MLEVDIAEGSLRGCMEQDVMCWYGIPYAEPLHGLGRIRAPQPRCPWVGMRDARQFGCSVPQEVPAFLGVENMGDDCLNLNVWSPSVQGKRPVMVWIHGGGYLNGSSSQTMYRGHPWARKEDVVIVSINYRIGLVGFADWHAWPELQGVTNCGLRDMVLALTWVQKNIHAFGGDPGSVTLFGQSAGAMAISALLAVPAARGLFHRAILQSGSADHVLMPEVARQVTAKLAAQTGSLYELFSAGSWQEILQAQRTLLRVSLPRSDYTIANMQFGMPALPCLDDDFLPALPLQSELDIPLLVGTARDEWALYLFMPELMGGQSARDVVFDERAWQQVVSRGVPEIAHEMVKSYQQIMPASTPAARIVAFETDRIFRISSLALAEKHAPNSYVYRLDWSCTGNRRLGACHVIDLPLVWGQVDSPLGKFFTGGDEDAIALSSYMMHCWSSFAREGVPSQDWPAYGQQRWTPRLDRDRQFQPDPQGERRQLWSPYMGFAEKL
ncbi:MAG: carboxylesterase family protein [Pseudomonadales bacterium]|nr:carboxylesterase family protein [Pseudomonadales bacterium]